MRNLLSTGPHVTLRFFRFLPGFLLLMLALLAQLPAHAEGIEIRRAAIEATDEGYRLAATYSVELSPEAENTLQYGRTLYFLTEIEFTRPRWYWFDEKAVTARRTISLSYNVLTRQYNVGISGSLLHQSFSSLDEALQQIRTPARWVVAARGALKVGETYHVKLSMGLDPSYVPKPLKVNALNNDEWRLSLDKKVFQYRAE
jgi:hypothetical protein